MDMSYFMKIQNVYGTNSRREKEIVKANSLIQKYFEDTYAAEDVFINGLPGKLMIIKDNDSNAVKKRIKACHDDKFNLGDYVLLNKQYWLITSLDPDENTCNNGYMYLCTVPLRWQNSDGKVIVRWAYLEDIGPYSSGVTATNTLKVGSNQYSLILPIDSETKKLNRDRRFAIDFDDAEEPDIYMLTNRKVNRNNNQYFGRGGIMTVTMSFDAFNPAKDKFVTLEEDLQAWICDYRAPALSPEPSAPAEPTELSAFISGGTSLRCGRAHNWTVKFTDKNGCEVSDCNFKWNVSSDFNLNQKINGQKIQLRADDEHMINRDFLLQVLNFDDVVIAEAAITVIEGL